MQKCKSAKIFLCKSVKMCKYLGSERLKGWKQCFCKGVFWSNRPAFLCGKGACRGFFEGGGVTNILISIPVYPNKDNYILNNRKI